MEEDDQTLDYDADESTTDPETPIEGDPVFGAMLDEEPEALFSIPIVTRLTPEIDSILTERDVGPFQPTNVERQPANAEVFVDDIYLFVRNVPTGRKIATKIEASRLLDSFPDPFKFEDSDDILRLWNRERERYRWLRNDGHEVSGNCPAVPHCPDAFFVSSSSPYAFHIYRQGAELYLQIVVSVGRLSAQESPYVRWPMAYKTLERRKALVRKLGETTRSFGVMPAFVNVSTVCLFTTMTTTVPTERQIAAAVAMQAVEAESSDWRLVPTEGTYSDVFPGLSGHCNHVVISNYGNEDATMTLPVPFSMYAWRGGILASVAGQGKAMPIFIMIARDILDPIKPEKVVLPDGTSTDRSTCPDGFGRRWLKPVNGTVIVAGPALAMQWAVMAEHELNKAKIVFVNTPSQIVMFGAFVEADVVVISTTALEPIAEKSNELLTTYWRRVVFILPSGDAMATTTSSRMLAWGSRIRARSRWVLMQKPAGRIDINEARYLSQLCRMRLEIEPHLTGKLPAGVRSASRMYVRDRIARCRLVADVRDIIFTPGFQINNALLEGTVGLLSLAVSLDPFHVFPTCANGDLLVISEEAWQKRHGLASSRDKRPGLFGEALLAGRITYPDLASALAGVRVRLGNMDALGHVDEINKCPICLETTESGPIDTYSLLDCGHAVCRIDLVMNWPSGKPFSCPLCRQVTVDPVLFRASATFNPLSETADVWGVDSLMFVDLLFSAILSDLDLHVPTNMLLVVESQQQIHTLLQFGQWLTWCPTSKRLLRKGVDIPALTSEPTIGSQPAVTEKEAHYPVVFTTTRTSPYTVEANAAYRRFLFPSTFNIEETKSPTVFVVQRSSVARLALPGTTSVLLLKTRKEATGKLHSTLWIRIIRNGRPSGWPHPKFLQISP